MTSFVPHTHIHTHADTLYKCGDSQSRVFCLLVSRKTIGRNRELRDAKSAVIYRRKFEEQHALYYIIIIGSLAISAFRGESASVAISWFFSWQIVT